MTSDRYIISKFPDCFCGWPDLVLCPDNSLLCTYTACVKHTDHSSSSIVCSRSTDGGRTWSAPVNLTGQAKLEQDGYYYNNASMRFRKDGVLTLLVDRIYGADENRDDSHIIMFNSGDNGLTWDRGTSLPARGIVPDRLLETSSGRWLVPCHRKNQETNKLEERLWYSDDRGTTWQGPIMVACAPNLNLCEASIIEAKGQLVCLLRENSWCGNPAYRVISKDDGLTWSAPEAIALPCCHRPRTGYLEDGRIFITFRFAQCGEFTTQNLFGALTSPAQMTRKDPRAAGFRIIPLDYDCAYYGDTGYSGWVELPDHSLYVVNYLKNHSELPFVHGFIVPPERLTVANDVPGWPPNIGE